MILLPDTTRGLFFCPYEEYVERNKFGDQGANSADI